MRKYLLLQLNDSLFPIGGYSHSYGLETYIQKGIVNDGRSAENYIQKKLTQNLAYGDFLAIRLSYEYAQKKEYLYIDELEDRLDASKIPMEIREASRKLGSRFVKTVLQMGEVWENESFQQYIQLRKGKSVSHPCAYGVFCFSMGISLSDALSAYMYGQASAMVTNCVKTIPLSQTEGQKILYRLHSWLEKTYKRVMCAEKEMLCAGTPGFDLRCIQHEKLYSRLYMS